jgi:hypothetical protein
VSGNAGDSTFDTDAGDLLLETDGIDELLTEHPLDQQEAFSKRLVSAGTL